MRAAKDPDRAAASIEFDDAFTSHIGHTISNAVRAFAWGLCRAIIAPYPSKAAPETRRYFQQVTRLSAAFAFLADVSMLALGGALKRKEKISGRLGDVLSMMYLVSCTLKRYNDQGAIREDLPLVRWAVRDCLYQAQQAIDAILANFPNRFLAFVARATIFPLGTPFRPPLDQRNHECATLVLEPGAARDRLTAGMYVPKDESDATGILEAAFLATVACEPIEKRLRAAVKGGELSPRAGLDLPTLALEKGVISAEEFALWRRKEALRRNVIKVDDFPQDFGRAEIMDRLASEQRITAKAA